MFSPCRLTAPPQSDSDPLWFGFWFLFCFVFVLLFAESDREDTFILKFFFKILYLEVISFHSSNVLTAIPQGGRQGWGWGQAVQATGSAERRPSAAGRIFTVVRFEWV